MTRVGKGEPLDRKVGNPDIDTRFGVTSELPVTRPELWETKISRPATLDECIGDLSLMEITADENGVYWD